MLGGTANVWILRIGMRLTTSSDTPIIHTVTTHSASGVSHQSPGNCILAASGPIAPIAPAGAGIPTKYSFS